MSGETYYELLGVDVTASIDDIGDAFLEEVVKVHPDILQKVMTLQEQDNRFRRLCLGYSLLSDYITRNEYDELNREKQIRVAARLGRKDGEEIFENAACMIYENYCISKGKIANRVLREYLVKRDKQQKAVESASPKAASVPKRNSNNDFDDDDDADGGDGDLEEINTQSPIKKVVKSNDLDKDVYEDQSASTSADPNTNPHVPKPKLGMEDLIRAVKFNMRVEITRILFHHPHLVNELDSSGYSPVHWAAKNGDVSILQTLHINGAKLNIASKSEHSMMPIHWAASDGMNSTIRYLLDNNVSINVQDSNGCTPIVIAAQHDRQLCCIYLFKQGADMSLVDNNGDAALHWAAYKGFSVLLGLLCHISPENIDKQDEYGQSPLHLAALRGNHEALEYLLLDCKADYNVKDKNGLNALALAIKKKQFKCEWILRQVSNNNNTLALVQSLEVKQLMDSNILKSIFCASNEREMSVWPWRLVFASNFIGTCYTFLFAFSEEMNDLWLLHMLNIGIQSLWWFGFWMCLGIDNLAIVNDELVPIPIPINSNENNNNTDQINGNNNDTTSNEINKKITRYNEALNIIGNDPSSQAALSYNLCHTCHVVKPLRSKHCKIQRCCINKFDHFCPFVYNTVSRDNYKYFMIVINSHAIVSILWFITSMFYCQRVDNIGFKLYAYIAYLGAWSMAIGSLVKYHSDIIVGNLTTNESINLAKYKHFFDNNHRFDNPFDLKNSFDNVTDSLFPSTVQVYTREEAINERDSKMRKNKKNNSNKKNNRNHPADIEQSERLLDSSASAQV
jgi:palmitoyltransferase ZDHHC13/17